MKTYIIDRIGNQNVKVTVEGLNELERSAIYHAKLNGGNISSIYVHCSHVVTIGKNWSDEQNVEYRVRVNNQKNTIKRIQSTGCCEKSHDIKLY